MGTAAGRTSESNGATFIGDAQESRPEVESCAIGPWNAASGDFPLTRTSPLFPRSFVIRDVVNRNTGRWCGDNLSGDGDGASAGTRNTGRWCGDNLSGDGDGASAGTRGCRPTKFDWSAVSAVLTDAKAMTYPPHAKVQAPRSHLAKVRLVVPSTGEGRECVRRSSGKRWCP